MSPQDDHPPVSFTGTSGEPRAGTEPGDVDDAGDEVQEDPGSAGDTADVAGDGQTAVTPADPAAAQRADDRRGR